jgi:hypothetical protein
LSASASGAAAMQFVDAAHPRKMMSAVFLMTTGSRWLAVKSDIVEGIFRRRKANSLLDLQP